MILGPQKYTGLRLSPIGEKETPEVVGIEPFVFLRRDEAHTMTTAESGKAAALLFPKPVGFSVEYFDSVAGSLRPFVLTVFPDRKVQMVREQAREGGPPVPDSVRYDTPIILVQ